MQHFENILSVKLVVMTTTSGVSPLFVCSPPSCSSCQSTTQQLKRTPKFCNLTNFCHTHTHNLVCVFGLTRRMPLFLSELTADVWMYIGKRDMLGKNIGLLERVLERFTQSRISIFYSSMFTYVRDKTRYTLCRMKHYPLVKVFTLVLGMASWPPVNHEAL